MIKKILLSAVGLIGLATSQFTNGTIDQQLDHFDATVTTTFKQRYFQNDTFWDSSTQSGPIFLYICGESTCQPPSLKGRGYPFQVCQELGCLFYVLEHRYYGESQPMADWSTDNLKYLNSTQALADLDFFIKNRNAALDQQYKAATRKWVTIGGSYPGALSAWFKNQYPTSAVAAWSSSGVIKAIQNYDEFDMDIYQASSRSGPACPAQIKAITDHIEQAVAGKLNATDLAFVQSVFNNTNVDNGDFMFYIADIFTIGIQYGGRTELCNLITSVSGASMNLQLPVLKQFADSKGVTLNQYDRVSLQNTTMNFQDNMRQWTWQYCTEFGWFQVPYATNPMRSTLINSTYWIPYCQEIFGKDKITGPAVDFYNTKYGGLDITGSNIIFVNAIEDPWQYAGMRTIQDPVAQKDMVAYLVDCNNCGHCVELYDPVDADTPALRLTRNKIKAKLTEWLSAKDEEVKLEELVSNDFQIFLQ